MTEIIILFGGIAMFLNFCISIYKENWHAMFGWSVTCLQWYALHGDKIK